MKTINSILFFLTLIALNSCSDTKVYQDAIVVNPGQAPASGYFKKRLLIEDYTGTWCGNCTRVSYAIEEVMAQTDKVVAVAIHNGNDPYNFTNIQPLKDLILPNSDLELPQSRLNRVTTWTFPETSNIQQALDLTDNNCGLGLAMKSTVANGILNLDVNIKFTTSYSNLKLVVYVLESNLIHSQTNYSPYFGSINPVPNFQHNHVLRTSLTNLLGDVITENTDAGQSITKNFTTAVPANISNVANLNFVAFLVDSNNNAINSRASNANENQNFEQNP